jgi:hypothetical protein
MMLLNEPYAVALPLPDAIEPALLPPANLSLLDEASVTVVNVRSRPAVLIAKPLYRIRGVEISPWGGRCDPYSSARLNLLRAYISAMPSMASLMSGSIALRIPSNEKASTEGRFVAAVIDCPAPPVDGLAEAGRDLSILEYVRTSTG